MRYRDSLRLAVEERNMKSGEKTEKEEEEIPLVTRRILILDMEVSSMHKLGTVVEDLSITPLNGSDGGFVSFERIDDRGLYQTFESYAGDMVDYIVGDGDVETVIAAHNGLAHDFLILLDNLSNMGISERLSQIRFLDTLPLFRRICPGTKIDLKSLCKRFGVDSKRAHSAKGDSDSLAAVLRSDAIERDAIKSSDLLPFSHVRRLMDNYTKMDYQQKQARHHMRYVFGKKVSDSTINKLTENGITVAKIREMVVSEPKKGFIKWMLESATRGTMTDTQEIEIMWTLFKPEEREETVERPIIAVKYPFGGRGIYVKRLEEKGITLNVLKESYDSKTEDEFKKYVIEIFETKVEKDDRGNVSLGTNFVQKKSKAETLCAYFRHVGSIKGETERPPTLTDRKKHDRNDSKMK